MSKVTLKKISKSVKKNFIFYLLGLLLCLDKKNCTKMAKVLNRCHDSLYRFLINHAIFVYLFPIFFLKLANYYAHLNTGFLIIDDSSISKIFARCLEKAAWVYNSSIRRPDRGLCIVVLAWSNGSVTIPLTFTWWFSKKVSSPEDYKTKIQCACRLIDQIGSRLKFSYLLADGLYFSSDMVAFLNDRSIKFIMRCASNRKITTSDGECSQIKEHSALRFKRNQHSKGVKALYGNQTIYFIAQKRRNKNNEVTIIYLASTLDLCDSDYITTYAERWGIEPFFRTAKSYLGLSNCSAVTLDKQANHVFAVFFAYNFLQFQKIRLKLENPEQALSALRDLKVRTVLRQITSFNQMFGLFA